MPAYLKFVPGGVIFPKSIIRNSNSNSIYSNRNVTMDASLAPDTYVLAEFSENMVENSTLSSPGGGVGGSTPRSGGRRRSSGNGRSFVFASGAASSSSPSADGYNINSGGKSESNGTNDMQNADALVYKAKLADDRLHSYIRLFAGSSWPLPSSTMDGNNKQPQKLENAPFFLPSLSVLANGVFGRLTGVPPSSAKSWADAMVLQYHCSKEEENRIYASRPRTEEDVANEKPAAMKYVTKKGNTTVALLKRLLEEEQSSQMDTCLTRPRRPCGYVFKRGDIAWNCRTCQTDSTCVLCDDCFRGSDHTGHEVFFHRTNV